MKKILSIALLIIGILMLVGSISILMDGSIEKGAAIPSVIIGVACCVPFFITKKKSVSGAPKENPYVDMTRFDTEEGLPVVNYPNINLASDEFMFYASPANYYTEKEKVVGYTGKSSGVSVRLAKGLSYRTGGSGSKAIRENVRDFYAGDYIVTNKRLIFIGAKKSFEIKIGKVTAMNNSYANVFSIIANGKNYNINIDNHDWCHKAFVFSNCSVKKNY